MSELLPDEVRCQRTADGADETYWLFCDREAGHEGMCHDPFWGDFDGDRLVGEDQPKPGN